MKWKPKAEEHPVGPVMWYPGKTAYWVRPRDAFPKWAPSYWGQALATMGDVDIGRVVAMTYDNTAIVEWRIAGRVEVPLYLLRDPHEVLATSAVEGAQYGMPC